METFYAVPFFEILSRSHDFAHYFAEGTMLLISLFVIILSLILHLVLRLSSENPKCLHVMSKIMLDLFPK